MVRGTTDDKGTEAAAVTCAATAAQIVLRPLKQASCFKAGLSLLQLHVGDVPLHEQQVHLLYQPSKQLQRHTETVGKWCFVFVYVSVQICSSVHDSIPLSELCKPGICGIRLQIQTETTIDSADDVLCQMHCQCINALWSATTAGLLQAGQTIQQAAPAADSHHV